MGGFGALLLRPNALLDAKPPLFPGLGPAHCGVMGVLVNNTKEDVKTDSKCFLEEALPKIGQLVRYKLFPPQAMSMTTGPCYGTEGSSGVLYAMLPRNTFI